MRSEMLCSLARVQRIAVGAKQVKNESDKKHSKGLLTPRSCPFRKQWFFFFFF
jgi:hypothetical protein